MRNLINASYVRLTCVDNVGGGIVDGGRGAGPLRFVARRVGAGVDDGRRGAFFLRGAVLTVAPLATPLPSQSAGRGCGGCWGSDACTAPAAAAGPAASVHGACVRPTTLYLRRVIPWTCWAQQRPALHLAILLAWIHLHLDQTLQNGHLHTLNSQHPNSQRVNKKALISMTNDLLYFSWKWKIIFKLNKTKNVFFLLVKTNRKYNNEIYWRGIHFFLQKQIQVLQWNPIFLYMRNF